MKVAVAHGLPSSIRKVAYMIADANGWPVVTVPQAWKDYDVIVYVSDTRYDAWYASRLIPKGHGVFYLVSEGPVRVKLAPHINVHTVVTPTKFVKDMLEYSDIHVDYVVPHGIEVPESYSPVSKKNGFFYRAYYLPRKYPSYGLKALEEYVKRYGSDGIDIYLVGPPHFPKDVELWVKFNFMKMKNPILPDELAQLYDTHLFYLNFSDAEGFGLTPLEAMSYGEIVITPYYPAIRDYLPVDCNIAVGIKGYWLEKLDYEYILHAEYDADNFLKAMEIAREMAMGDRTELERWSKCNRKVAESYDYKKVYKAFAKIAEETVR